MKTVCIIPARIGSLRLPRKPLADICGDTLIARVYRNALKLTGADEIIVATDSEEVAGAAGKAGARAVLTPGGLLSGSDRALYAARKYFPKAELVLNLQGDEPFIDVSVADRLIEEAKQGADADVFSAFFPVSREEASNESVVKVVTDLSGFALYFSRSPVPYGAERHLKHLGLYLWRRDALERFGSLEPAPLEKSEGLEQLRALENGMRIKMIESPSDSFGIDTVEDIERARSVLREN